MQEVKIEKINFTNGMPNCPETCIDENLMEQFKSLLDIEKFKNILSSTLKDASNKINIFEWGVELFFINVKDDLSSDSYIRIGCNIYQLDRYGYRASIIFYDCHDKLSEFKIHDEDLSKKDISLIFFDFFEFISSMNTYVSVFMYRNFNQFENCGEELTKNKVLYFNSIDYIDQEFDYKYKKNLAECDYINYLVGKDIRFENGQKINIDAYDCKGVLMCLILFRCIPNQLDSEEVFSIFQDDDLKVIIENLKLLLY